MDPQIDERTAKLLKKFSDILTETGDPDDEKLYQMYVQNSDNEMFVYMSMQCLEAHIKEKQRARRAAFTRLGEDCDT